MSISGEQSRAARALLGWSQAKLAERAKVARQTLIEFERGTQRTYERTLADIEEALRKAGVEFIPENGGGAGVRLKKPKRKK